MATMLPDSGARVREKGADCENPCPRKPHSAGIATRSTLPNGIRTKRVPMIGRDVDAYVDEYRAYFQRNETRGTVPLTMLDPAPRVVLDRDLGFLTAGRTARDAAIAADIYSHTIDAIEGQPAGVQPLVVAADAVLVQHLTRLDRRGGCCCGCQIISARKYALRDFSKFCTGSPSGRF